MKQSINFVHFFGMVFIQICVYTILLLNWRHNGTVMNLSHDQFFEPAPEANIHFQGPRTQQPEQLGR